MSENNQNELLQADTMLGSYKIIKKIGSGGMGAVYLALDTKLHRNVAIKVLLSDYFEDEEKITRFKREATTAASINHANIMSIHAIDEATLDTGQRIEYIVMEYIEGDTLDKYLISKENIPKNELLRISEKLASGLAAAHSKGVVHRDIKLGNVIITNEHDPKILDFGLAKPIDTTSINKKDDSISEDTESVINDLTQEGKIVGTISYMSPEQLRSGQVDFRSDIFSLGVLLYRMFTGKFPFEGSENVSIIAKIIEAPHTPIRTIDANLSPELERIINKCLQKDPNNRYQDTRDLVIDLRNIRKQMDSGISDSISGFHEINKSHSTNKSKSLAWSAVAVVFILLVLYFADPFAMFDGKLSAQENSLAVINFENLSDAEDKERLGQIMQELLITDLSTNNQVKVISSQRLFDIQKTLGIDNRNKIDASVAVEVAKKSGAGTMISGNIINTGDEWLITGQIIDVHNGTVIKSHRLKGPDIYGMVDSLSEIILSDLSIANNPTNEESEQFADNQISMEAYQHYFTGIENLGDADYLKAVNEFKKAIEIEPDFSKAYYKLIIALWWQNDNELNKKSEELVQDVLNHTYSSKHDKLLVEAAYALYEHRYTDARFNYEKLAELYPDDKEVWYGYGEALYHDGNNYRRKSMEAFEKAIALDESFILGYRHIFDLYKQFEMAKPMHETAQKLVKAKPESPIGYRVLATSTIFLGTEEEISATEKEAFNRSNTEDDTLNLYADLMLAYTMKEKFDKSLAYYSKAMENNRTNSSPALLRLWEIVIGIYQRQGKEKEIFAVFEQFHNCNVPLPQKLNMVVNGVQRFFDNGNTRKKAHAILNSGFVMDTNHTFTNLYAVAAQLALVERKYDSAVSYANQALELQSNHAWASNVKFNALLYAKRFEEAKNIADEKIKSDPNNALNYSDMIFINIYSDNIPEAESYINTAVRLDTAASRLSTFYSNVGVAFSNIQRHDKSREYFEKVLKIDPQNTSSIEEIARSYYAQKDFKNGDRYSQKLIENENSKTLAYVNLTKSNLIQKRFNEASLWLNKMDMSNASNLRMHGYYHMMLQNYDSAHYYAQEAYKLDQKFFSINLLAHILVIGEYDIDRGIQLAELSKISYLPYNHFDIFIEESPFVPLPDETIALGYYKKGRYLDAKGQYELAIKLRPDDKDLQEARERVVEKLKS